MRVFNKGWWANLECYAPKVAAFLWELIWPRGSAMSTSRFILQIESILGSSKERWHLLSNPDMSVGAFLLRLKFIGHHNAGLEKRINFQKLCGCIRCKLNTHVLSVECFQLSNGSAMIFLLLNLKRSTSCILYFCQAYM